MSSSDHLELDAEGLFCPEPVMMLHNAMRQIEVGHVVKIVATDPSTQRDIPKFCQFLGHTLLEVRVSNADGSDADSGDVRFVYRIAKAAKNLTEKTSD